MVTSFSPTPAVPSFLHAAICFGGVITIISFGLFYLAIDLHSLMFVCLLWMGVNSKLLGHGFTEIRQMMSGAINQALPAIYIFILIGMVISSFMNAGTIASLVYYGLELLSPSIFLAAGLVLCSFMSVATGTAWGTAGTIGVVLIGIGGAMGLPLALVAGVVVSGATFGDKLSPISDTTNLAAMSSGTDLYRHIRSMLYTTIPTFLIMLVILLVLGNVYEARSPPVTDIESIQIALSGAYQLNPLVTLLPLALMLFLSIRRVPAEITMSASILLATVIAILFQGEGVATVLNNLWLNSPGNTGIVSLDDLLGRGGVSSMASTLLLALMALALGGILHQSGILNQLLSGLIKRVKRLSGLIAMTIFSGFLGNMAMGEAYISIILNCQLFKPHFEAMDLDNAVLSRSVEEGATLTTGLIPWTTAGAFYSATLGVSVLDYAPFALFNYLNAFVSVAMVSLGFGLLKAKS